MKRDERYLLINGFIPVVPQCMGCNRIEEDGYCRVYANPIAQWRNKNCNMSTHIEKEVKKDDFKLNPLKASKRSMGK